MRVSSSHHNDGLNIKNLVSPAHARRQQLVRVGSSWYASVQQLVRVRAKPKLPKVACTAGPYLATLRQCGREAISASYCHCRRVSYSATGWYYEKGKGLG